MSSWEKPVVRREGIILSEATAPVPAYII